MRYAVRSQMRRLILLAAAVGALLGFVIGMQVPPVPVFKSVDQHVGVRVTFYNCGRPTPCESIENLTGQPVQVTVRNTYQSRFVVVPAYGRIDIQTDDTDNMPGAPVGGD